MFQKNFIVASLSAACLFTCVGASAQGYVGATVGKASWSDNCAPGGYACSQNTGNSTAFQILGGYEFSRHWGVEASYYDMGTITTNYYYYSGIAELKSTGVDLAAVVRFPFGASGFSSFVKMGLSYDHGKSNGYNNSNSYSYNSNSSNTAIQPMFGLGLTYKFNENLSGRFDIDSRHTRLSSINSSISAYITTINFGVVTKF